MPKKQANRKSSNGSTESKSTKLTAPKRSAAAQVNKPAAAVPERKSAPVKTQPKQLASAEEKKRPARKASTIIAERNTAASQPTPAKSRKRAASVVEREEAEDKEDFGTVSIDADSSSEESAGEEENDGEDDQIEEFPELNLESDDDSEDGDDDDGEDEQAEKEESEEEDDDYMAGDSLDEEELDMLEQSKPEIDNYLSANNHERPKLPEIEADYDSDTSTEETENTVGNIPMEWYKDLPHIGYDIDGKRILKPATSDELEKFLAMEEDPDAWKSVHSEKEGKDIVLNDEELDIIRRLQEGEIPDADYNPYEPTVEFFTSKQEIMPLSGAPEPKRRFVPSKWEAKKIMKIVRAIRAGRIVPRKPKDEKPRFYNLWGDDDQPHKDHIMHIPAPKMPLPEHDESYNPPEEYLPDEDEIKAWQEEDEEDRKKNYLPKKYKSLRHVPAYENFVKERFQRCLDLYLAPRVRKNRLNIDPDSLLPKLPSPKDLRPFPTHQSLSYEGHTARIRSISIHPSGLYALSGSDDQTVRLWEVSTGRCLFLWQFDAVIHVVAWNPNRDLWLFAVSIGDGKVLLVSPPKLCSSEQATFTDQFVKSGFALANDQDEEGRPKKKIIEWERASKEEEEKYGFKLRLQHELAVKQITWHRKGDYFATVSPDAKGRALLLHQVTKHQSQRPFRNLKGLVQRVAFHPTKPFFFVATQISVRMYDLMRQTLEKKMQPGAKWISSIDVHPGGDNIIVGTYDKKVCWFDLDLGAYPYKSLRYHTMAVRNVVYHRRYPLFATASDDGTIQIYHGTVYDDLLQNPLIVPVKILRGHEIKSSLGVLDIQFHPTQPWIFSCGADNTFRLWT